MVLSENEISFSEFGSRCVNHKLKTKPYHFINVYIILAAACKHIQRLMGIVLGLLRIFLILAHSVVLYTSLHYNDVIMSTMASQITSPPDCLLNRLFKSKKTLRLRVTGLFEGNSPVIVNSPHKGPVTRRMLPFNDAIMVWNIVYQLFVIILLTRQYLLEEPSISREISSPRVSWYITPHCRRLFCHQIDIYLPRLPILKIPHHEIYIYQPHNQTYFIPVIIWITWWNSISLVL